MRTTLFFLVFCCISMATTDSACAGSMSQLYIDNAAVHEQKMQEAKVVLEGHDPSEWIDAGLADYQVNMGAAIYNAVVAYCFDNEQLPNDLGELVGMYLTEWPQNPQNNWEPVRVLGLGDGFAAGEVVFQECSYSYYSIAGRIKDNMLTAQSFELGVYGPSIDHYQETSINLANEDWGIVPAGTIILMGMYSESALDVLVRHRAREEEKALQDEIETPCTETDGEEKENQ